MLRAAGLEVMSTRLADYYESIFFAQRTRLPGWNAGRPGDALYHTARKLKVGSCTRAPQKAKLGVPCNIASY
jgi:hypothetical protein